MTLSVLRVTAFFFVFYLVVLQPCSAGTDLSLALHPDSV